VVFGISEETLVSTGSSTPRLFRLGLVVVLGIEIDRAEQGHDLNLLFANSFLLRFIPNHL
jgi:hypothetical protein